MHTKEARDLPGLFIFLLDSLGFHQLAVGLQQLRDLRSVLLAAVWLAAFRPGDQVDQGALQALCGGGLGVVAVGMFG